jgi:ABC-type glycerol-3-phosphate transport system substrate-binding protein
LQETQSSERVVDAVVNSLNTTSERVSETVAAMTRLRDRISQIGQISQLLAGVAYDTHLLSLNAAIESASAGSYGMRFSIIAEEVYTLAARTREGSAQVSQLVQELDSALLTTEAAANAGLAQTTMTTAMTNVLTTATTVLTASAQRTQQLATAIDQAMTQQRIGATQVSVALNSIADSALNMSSQSNAVATRATDLTTVAGQLRQSALLFGRSATSDRAMRLLIAGRETVSQRGLAWNALVDGWNQQHPSANIAIEFIPPSPDYIPNLRLALAEQRAPDIIQIPGNAEFGILAHGDYLVPLEGLIKPAVRSDFYPQLLTPSLSDGHLYTLPTEAQPLVLFYSKKLFAQLGLNVPRSWDELIALGLRCRQADRWGIVMETGPGDFRLQHWLPFFWQGGMEITDSRGRLRMSQPAAQAALQFWHELFAAQRVAPLKPPHPGYDIANLAEGHCAIQYIGSWGMNMLRESYPDFEYGIADLPLPPNGQPATMLLTWGLAVAANSPKREAAAEFVRWALATEGEEGAARVHSLMVEGLPVRRSAVALVNRAGTPDPNWQFLLEQIYPHSHITPPLSDADVAAADKMIGEAIKPQ